MDSPIWSRRTNPSKLSLATPANTDGASSSGRANGSSLSKRFGGDSSSHGKTNPFNSITTPGGLSSPTGASSAFGLGSGAFASFGAKTPKSPGHPFEGVLAGGGAKTPAIEKSAKDGRDDGLNKAAGKLASLALTADSKRHGAAAAAASGSAGGSPAQHVLRHKWTFWFRPPISKANGFIEYEKTLHPIAGCGSVEEFFAVYAHLKRPSTLPLVSDYHLFKQGIRPIWEDDVNKKGGKWIVRLRKGVADRYWEDLLLAIIGDQFGSEGEEVCGAVLSVRNGEDILSIWTKTDGGKVLKIRETMKRVLAFPPDTKVEWKSHDSSIQQRTAVDEARREKAANNHEKRSKQQQQQQQLDT